VTYLHHCGKDLGQNYAIDYSNASDMFPPYPDNILTLFRQIKDSREFVATVKEKIAGFDQQAPAIKTAALFNRYVSEYFTARAHTGIAKQIEEELSKSENAAMSYEECWQVIVSYLSDGYRQAKPIYCHGSFVGMLNEIIHMAIKDDAANYQTYISLLDGISSLTSEQEASRFDKVCFSFGMDPAWFDSADELAPQGPQRK